jgi:hypothetical protein
LAAHTKNVDWHWHIVRWGPLPEPLIDAHLRVLPLAEVVKSQKVSQEFIARHLDKLTWGEWRGYQPHMSPEFRAEHEPVRWAENAWLDKALPDDLPLNDFLAGFWE